MNMIRRMVLAVAEWRTAQRRSRSQRLALAELMALSPARLEALGIDVLTVREALRERGRSDGKVGDAVPCSHHRVIPAQAGIHSC